MKHVLDCDFEVRLTCPLRGKRAECVSRAIRLRDSLDRFDHIKEFYRLAYAQIMAEPNGYGIDPYEVDWHYLFTPIEEAIWHEIRCYGLVMYPQLPVGPYFVDFGNPHAKVAIECDGAAYHDRAKDYLRDAHLAERGWRVYRISGRDCLAEVDEETRGLSLAAQFVKYVQTEITRRLEKA